MKKILIAFDGGHFSEGAFRFAFMMNEHHPILLTGVFLPEINYANMWSYSDGLGGPLFLPPGVGADPEPLEKNIALFENVCRKNNIDYRVHKDFSDFALPDLKKETRFADLAILGSESFYRNLGTGHPNGYLQEALREAECPVVVVPEDFEFPESNILAYNGSKSSVYAIKQFAYLFPEFCDNKTLLVTASDESMNEFPDESYIKELAARHFTDLTFLKVEIDPKKYFSLWVSEKKKPILVTGSFGRSLFSQLFKRSFVSDVIQEHKLPVFITHR